jgi:pyridoxal phosphate enzyme (YggS family)
LEAGRDALLLTRLRANLAAVKRRIEAARGGSARAAPAVDVLVVTKSAPSALFPYLREAGVTDVAENRVQAAAVRRPLSPPGWRWHGIGHLQRNKARRAVDLFDVFHALDSRELAEQLESVLASANRRWPVYIQVNAADDPRKGGIAPAEALPFVKALADLPHLSAVGFMTMARLGSDGADTRRAFRTLREVRDEVVRLGVGRAPPTGLSMGMSADFETAVEEGATIVRVGSAVFEGLELEPEPVAGEHVPLAERRGARGADARREASP